MSGPAAGTRCGVCEHARSGEINSMVNAGVLSSAVIARKFGLAKDQVSRHKFRRHPGVVVAAAAHRAPRPSGPADPDDGELARLRTLRAQLEGDMAARPRSDTARELRQVHARIAELDGDSAPKRVGVADVEGLAEQVRRWLEALEPFPDAREAMLRATSPELLGGEG